MKKIALPPRLSRRRENGTGTLSRHVDHVDGVPVPYEFDEKKRPRACQSTGSTG